MAETNMNMDDEFNVDDLELEEGDNSDDVKSDKDVVVLSKSKFVLIKKLLENARENNERLINLISGVAGIGDLDKIAISQIHDDSFNKGGEDEHDGEGKIVEGVFDGENMIGPDGKQYSIPANYASKSKLVEGDILKLTITPTGTFVYKQIGPIDRKRVVGTLEQGGGGSFIVNADGLKLKVLTASVTYFRGTVGDEVVVLVPKTGDSKWAAVDNIVRN
ncbi:hypothetical protein L6270_01115 [Candidatus Parcubacteria bacterium]|nr:hypothetical protein [Patescibacteria group bacterium]MBU4309745.1 hypothetical protein [Patescibacteria group bacterium]MBU4578084.1 hypothetical protein [Patescibacteria group bacterium]MCG2696622.1 hypothetical protein [Candidatus Parcubacteria bacterium]